MDKQNENHSASKNPILSSLLDSQKVNDNRKRSNQEEHEDESEDSENEDSLNESTQPSKKKKSKKEKGTRKNIRKIIDDEKLDERTKEARAAEEERIKRLLQREQRLKDFVRSTQLSFKPTFPNISKKNQSTDVVCISSDEEDNSKPATKPQIDDDDDDLICVGDVIEPEEAEEDMENTGSHAKDELNTKTEDGRVLVNTGHSKEEYDIFLPRQIESAIKPHQIGGVRFMFDNILESLEMAKKSEGFGCVLAHAMGLGKTLQVISFTDVFLRHSGYNHVLVIVPVNTIQNWKNEFNHWVPGMLFIIE
jgi:RAD54-like protein 2